MAISTPRTPANRLENNPEFQHDIVALKNFDFTNSRTWEVVETKGPERPFSGHGTWEGTENKAVVGNGRNRNFHGDKLPQCGAGFFASFGTTMVPSFPTSDSPTGDAAL